LVPLFFGDQESVSVLRWSGLNNAELIWHPWGAKRTLYGLN